MLTISTGNDRHTYTNVKDILYIKGIDDQIQAIFISTLIYHHHEVTLIVSVAAAVWIKTLVYRDE